MNIGELAKFRGGVSADTISELTAASGVTIDGTLIKDGGVSASGTVSVGTITEYASGSGVTIDETLIKDGGVTLKTGSEIQDAGGKYVKIKGGDGTAVAAGFVGETKTAAGTTNTTTSENTFIAATSALSLERGSWLITWSVSCSWSSSGTGVLLKSKMRLRNTTDSSDIAQQSSRGLYSISYDDNSSCFGGSYPVTIAGTKNVQAEAAVEDLIGTFSGTFRIDEAYIAAVRIV